MTLTEALKVVVEEEHLEDFIYTVRERACQSGDGYKGKSWDHPRVKRFNEAVRILKQHIS